MDKESRNETRLESSPNCELSLGLLSVYKADNHSGQQAEMLFNVMMLLSVFTVLPFTRGNPAPALGPAPDGFALGCDGNM